MDLKTQYEPLTQKLKTVLPLKAKPERPLVQALRGGTTEVTLKSELTIIDVFNSGDISGILCTIENTNGQRSACALTHLVFSPDHPLYKEIADYQKRG